ncbi:hypothetical protein BGY98DRAFT_324556 [Russula aff. rugulosa BPL654]|nr:hypothetical protein BGY98DRAFT_324556 [Russula aff. rugulosa BPL654]
MMTDAPRSHSPDIELGTRGLATPQPTRSTNQPSSDPGPSFHLPSYSLDAALHHAKVQSPLGPSRLASPLPPPAVPETVTSAGVAHPNSDEGNYGDPSDKIFSVYLAQADKFDKEQSESWKGDTEGILVFTGLFSATVAAFLIESYKQLQPSSSDTVILLLSQISQQLAALSSGSSISIPSGLPGQDFQPSASAIRVNILWFISLVLSLTCALLATLMQQWVADISKLLSVGTPRTSVLGYEPFSRKVSSDSVFQLLSRPSRPFSMSRCSYSLVV